MKKLNHHYTVLFLGLFIFFSALDLNAQKHKRVQRAYDTYEAGEYYEAIDLFKEALNIVSDRTEKNEIVYLIADCYNRINDPRKAEMWYNKAISRGYSDLEAYLKHAQMLKMNEEYEEAIIAFQKYKDLVPADPRGEEGIKSCRMAIQWKENPTAYVVENMRFFNSRNNDYSPYFASEDYGEVYFTSSREGSTGTEIHGATDQNFADIFSSTVDRKGSWSEPVPLSEEINTEFEDGAPTFTADFNTMYFTRCKMSKNKNFGCAIIVAERSGQSWNEAKSLKLVPDSLTVAHPSVSNDNLTLYFASNMEGSIGDYDIWKVERESASAEWGEPVNLGEEINTEGREVYPFIHPDGTLYFSSDGLLGMGGLDIFRAEEKTDGSWEVENMKYPVNSSADDFGIVFEAEKERGYFSSSRTARGDDDIFQFMLPPLRFNITGTVKDEKTDEPLSGAIVKSISSAGLTIETKTDEEGEFKFMLKPTTDYLFIASKEEYLNGKERESTKGLTQSQDFETTIYLASIDKPIELPNIFYDFADWKLRPESRVSLDNLVETLNDNPNITIELMSHTDNRGGEQSNLELSQKRAQSAVDYLISKGIDPDRLTAKGYGESVPKTLDEKTAERSRFFSAGDTLTEEFINNLDSPEKQEMAHQINRRTEFKVLRTDYVPKEK